MWSFLRFMVPSLPPSRAADELVVLEHEERIKAGYFVNDEQRELAAENLDKLKRDAEKAEARIERKKNLNNEIAIRIIEQYEKEPQENKSKDKNKNEIKLDLKQEPKIKYRADRLSSYSKAERKLISKIYDIIFNSIDAGTAEMLISKIEAELK